MPKKSSAQKENKGPSPKESHSMKHGSHGQGEGKGSGKSSSSHGNIPEIGLSGSGSSRNACLPKALMLLLPFIAAGAYLLLRT
jgi:hypothetical protein